LLFKGDDSMAGTKELRTKLKSWQERVTKKIAEKQHLKDIKEQVAKKEEPAAYKADAYFQIKRKRKGPHY
jgi:hypothetical protein